VDPAVQDPLVFTQLFPSRDDLAFGTYADVTLWPRGRVSVTPGVRADFYRSLDTSAFSVDPRIFATYRLTPHVRTRHGLGTAHQSPNFVPNIPGAQVGGLPGGLQNSLQWESSVEADLFWDLRGTVGAFINQTRDLSDPIGMSQSFSIDEDSPHRRALGRAAGIEVFLERPLTRSLGGLLSYTYSRTSRSFDSVDTVPGYDRPHVFNGALTYDFGSELRASAKLAIASGIPGRRVTPDGNEFIFDGPRSDPFIRLDAKLSKRWHPTPTFWWGSYIEVLNATHSSQVARRTCSPSGCRDEGTGPITIPSVGLEAGWR
jgi:outer membrane receptor protein involved in Fe transport